MKSASYQGVLRKLRKSRWTKGIALLCTASMLLPALKPLKVHALTSGPSQPEAEGFQQVTTTEMVDPFTGDFSYNIPLFDLGGYPVNLAYQSGITMDQEATWVGLGWNVNTGAITRNMRGLPDDFWSDTIIREYNVRPNETWGVNAAIGFEGFGLDPKDVAAVPSLTLGLDVSYNNYKGFNIGTSISPGISAGDKAKLPMNGSLGISSSQDGLTVSPNVSFSGDLGRRNGYNLKGSLGFGLSMNSRTGLSQMTLNGGVSATKGGKGKKNMAAGAHGSGEKRKSLSRNFGGNINFGTSTYTPQIDVPMENISVSFSGKLGLAAWGFDGDVTLGGYYSSQRLQANVFKSPAYGYIYSEKGNLQDNAILDFNREKDGSFTLNTPALPQTNFTYDVFNIQAQGIGGSFRGFRNDAGYVFDKSSHHPSGSGSLGVELSTSSIVDFGINVAVNVAESQSGAWRNSNSAASLLQFKPRSNNDPYENVHFKMAGEQNIDSDERYYSDLKKNTPVRFDLDAVGMDVNAKNRFITPNGNTYNFNTIERQVRQNRNMSISYLTVGEIKRSNPWRAKFISPYAKDHHIAEITIVTAEGTRYVFGLAAYNTYQKEITFNIGTGRDGSSPPTVNSTTGLVTYTAADNSPDGNKKGISWSYDATYTPPFAHTWFLTEVLSPDYVDVTGNGPTEDDLGMYTRFNYGEYDNTRDKYFPDIPNYLWRTPVSTTSFQASYNEGLKTDPTDDNANIVFGSKEIWYLHSIESKTQVAAFYLSGRDDGHGVSGVNSAVTSSNPLQKIDSISVYSQEEYKTQANPVPNQTIHFRYDYSLCDGVPNNTNDEGKLTLRQVFFTYKNSNRGRFSPYVFHYFGDHGPSASTWVSNGVDTSQNPSYSLKNYDRWGYYKKESGGLKNADFPYTEQDTVQQNINSAVWSLKKIQLPSGGLINVQYESDDYAYVQHKQATRMFKILGTGKSKNDGPTDKLFTLGIGGTFDNYQYLYFKLAEPIPDGLSESDAAALVRKQYFNNDAANPDGPLKYLYFRFLTRVTDQNHTEKNEYVSGYMEVDDPTGNNYCGVRTPSGGYYKEGWIKVKLVPVNDSGPPYVHPISKAAWQFCRIYTPMYAFHQPEPGESSIEQFIKLMASATIFNQLADFFAGPNVRMGSEGFGSTFEQDKSWIRLLEPDMRKLGGGLRVKQIGVDDNWETMSTGETSFEYAQNFRYTNPDGTSNGVAAYEPMVGADENIFRIPLYFGNKKQNLLIPDDRFYLEQPLGESFFPSPTVGYSRMEIFNEHHVDVHNNATGKVVHEFYTAWDFPTRVSHTDLKPEPRKSNAIMSLLNLVAFDYMTTSQGFVVELNDMHGKPKKQSVYAEGQSTPISSVEYIYKTTAKGHLDNSVNAILPNGTIAVKELGVDYDFVADMREQGTETFSINIQGNLASFMASIFPFFVPTIFPQFSAESTRYRSATTTKVINRYGVLERTIAYDLGSRMETKNIAWDALTGQVLLTQVNNEFDDDRYAFTYPAHWVYDAMGPASKNIGLEFDTYDGSSYINWNRSTGELLSPIKQYLVPGDEVIANGVVGRGLPPWSNGLSANTNRFWVSRDDGSGKLYLIREDGQRYTQIGATGNITFKIVRSGRRNLQSTPAGSVETLEPLLVLSGSDTIVQVDSTRHILTASATEFAEQWKMKNNSIFPPDSVRICEMDSNGMRLISLLNRIIHYAHLNTGGGFVDIDNSTYTGYTTVFDGCSPFETYTSSWGANKLSFQLSPLCENAEEDGCSSMTLEFTDGTTPSEGLLDHIFYFLPYVVHINPSSPLTGSDLAYITAVMDDGSHLIMKVSGKCITFNCTTTIRACTVSVNDTVNPYLTGILGNWRPKITYTYLTNRDENSTAIATRIREDGSYINFSPFWLIPSVSSFWDKTTHISELQWKWVAEITNYSPYGFELENKDALGNYSAALYGYKETLPIAVGQNTKYKEMAYDGFEDYYPAVTWGPCNLYHFKFEDFRSNVTDDYAHTGWYSIQVDDTVSVSRNFTAPHCQRTSRAAPYALQSCDLLGYFGPDNTYAASKDFILSFWVRKDGFNPTVFDYTDFSADVFRNTTSLLTVGGLKKSKMIEGWQQFEYRFTVPPSSTGVFRLRFTNGDGAPYYVDDVRIFPADANMQSFVYDANTLRYMAQLDENNYATFYEYDEDGKLVRVKKETERGIVTIQENRNKSHKQSLE